MSMKRKFLDSLDIFKDMVLDFLKLKHGYLVGLVLVVISGTLFEMAGWWYLMLLAGGIGGFIMKRSALASLLIGFVGIALVWSGFFIYFDIIGPLGEFTVLISSLLSSILGFALTPELLIIITVVIGGLLGSLGALNGTFIAKIIYPPESSEKELKLKDSKLLKE